MKKKKLKQTNASAHLIQYRFKIREDSREILRYYFYYYRLVFCQIFSYDKIGNLPKIFPRSFENVAKASLPAAKLLVVVVGSGRRSHSGPSQPFVS